MNLKGFSALSVKKIPDSLAEILLLTAHSKKKVNAQQSKIELYRLTASDVIVSNQFIRKVAYVNASLDDYSSYIYPKPKRRRSS